MEQNMMDYHLHNHVYALHDMDLMIIHLNEGMWQMHNVQLGISVGLSKALMASGIGLLLAGVGLLVSKIIEWRKSQQAANEVSEEARKKAEALAAIEDKTAADYGKGHHTKLHRRAFKRRGRD